MNAVSERKSVIETRGLTVYYGRHRGILDVNLTVRKGEVFGFLGPNGAGKTTTQRVLLDILRPTAGSATLFGLDCRKEGHKARRRIAYLPGELKLDENLTANDYLNFMDSLDRSRIDRTFRKTLCERMELDPSRKIREYSRGNKQKIGIVAAFMGRPDLLILDEPTTGLDPLKQAEVMALVNEVRETGRTVFLSSHILAEVQQVCDRVGIIREGRLIRTESVEGLTRQNFKRLRLVTKKPSKAQTWAIEGVKILASEGREVRLQVTTGLGEVMKRAVTLGLEDVETLPVTLEEIFLAYYGRNGNGMAGDNRGKEGSDGRVAEV